MRCRLFLLGRDFFNLPNALAGFYTVIGFKRDHFLIDNGHILYDGSLLEFKTKFGGENMLIVDFADEKSVIDDPRLKVIKEEGPRKSLLFSNAEITVAEAITLITRNYDITDLNLKEPQIEGIVKKIYENKGF